MDTDLPPLGPAKPWLVKDFPISLREEITRAAAGQGVTVGQWLVAHFQKHGVGGVEISRVYPTPVNAGNPSDDTDELRALLAMAREVTPDGRDSRALREGRAIVAERLARYRARQAPPALLPAPDQGP